MKNRRLARTTALSVLDVAHPPLSQEVVEDLLLQAWTESRNSSAVRVVKVIHGYGSSGKGGSTREVVRNWASRMGSKLLGVVAGEDFSIYKPESQALRQEVGGFDDLELEAGNKGVTYLWIR